MWWQKSVKMEKVVKQHAFERKSNQGNILTGATNRLNY